MENSTNLINAENNSRGSILIVDDNPNNLRYLSSILIENGYKVRPAPNGSIALRSVQSILPDLILLDIRLPDIDGYEVCRRLKQDEYSRDVPVIFISALDELGDKATAYKLGAVDYISKPILQEELLARVHTHVTLSTLQRRLAQLMQENNAANINEME